MTELFSWLDAANLTELHDVLLTNSIDLDVLSDLTDDDMRELGLNLGQRKRLRKAIDGQVRSLAESPQPVFEPEWTAGAEHRQLTVMFIDLVGSTALSAAHDVEDLREIMQAFQQCCAQTIERHGGTVAKYLGDGILAYFGYPRATEHDAERAVRAGLNVIEEVRALYPNEKSKLRTRIGAATGMVLVGDLIGEG
ncbi:MAG: adenylate/guanylate cyclase domain-containing protein, partial [Pseudomonadota bacterium]